MTLFNADGSRAEMSGNGIRCFAQAVATRRGDLGAPAHPHRCRRPARHAGRHRRSRRRSRQRSRWATSRRSPSRTAGRRLGCHPDRPVAHLSLGNPHSVVGVDEVAVVDLATLGAQVPHVNLEIIEPGPEPNAVTMRVHERGAGITEACGTGACAAAFAARSWGLVARGDGDVVVHMDGGTATVTFAADAPGRAVLTGPATPRRDHRGRRHRRRRTRSHEQRPVQRGTCRHAHRSDDPGEDRARRRCTARPGRRCGRREPRRARPARRHRRRRRRRPHGAAPRRAGPHVVHRQGQGGGTASALPGGRCRHRRVRQRALAGSAVQPGEAARADRARPHGRDPRHLRPERAHARRQGAGRTRPAAVPTSSVCVAAPTPSSRSSVVESGPVSAVARRRSRSIGGGSCAGSTSSSAISTPSPTPGRCNARDAHAAASPPWPSSATPMRASRRCSTA